MNLRDLHDKILELRRLAAIQEEFEPKLMIKEIFKSYVEDKYYLKSIVEDFPVEERVDGSVDRRYVYN
jgi:hypothetical protein